MSCFFISGVPGGIRTPDRCLRRALLYPAELLRRLVSQQDNYTTGSLINQGFLKQFYKFPHFLLQMKLD